jgi:hypothetical protein
MTIVPVVEKSTDRDLELLLKDMVINSEQLLVGMRSAFCGTNGLRQLKQLGSISVAK